MSFSIVLLAHFGLDADAFISLIMWMVNIFHMPVSNMPGSIRKHLFSFPTHFFPFLMELGLLVVVGFCQFF